jgi:FHA domain
MAIPRREAGMTGEVHSSGLWPVPGDGVLAREGDLVLLASIADADFADSLVALLAVVADAGDDGRQLASVVEDAVARSAWPATAGAPSRAAVAFGPLSTGLVLAVCGAAWADIATADGVQRLVSAHQGVQLRCVVSGPVTEVRAGLGSDHEDGHTDRFSHLDRGAIRAGGLIYIPERPAGPDKPSAARPTPQVVAGAVPEQVPDAIRAAAPGPAAADIVMPEPAAGPGSAVPVPSEPAEAADPGQAGPPFESVLLVGESTDGMDRQPALPLESAVADARAQDAPRAVVTGVYCKNGHFDDPDARFCAVCGISMNQQTLVPRPGPRPPLGVLAFDDGSVFQLDSDYVVGRDPALSPAVAAGQARPLCVVDDAGIVSRAHAAIGLDGWRVVVTDLDSANGTRIRHREDEADQPLVPRVPADLRPGSHVDLGGCGFRYESHRGR